MHRAAGRLGAVERHFQRLPLRRRKAVDRVEVDPVEEIDQRRERELCLSPAAARAQDASPRPLAASTPASQSEVLPTPGPPVSTSARGVPSDASSASTIASSASRPTMCPGAELVLRHFPGAGIPQPRDACKSRGSGGCRSRRRARNPDRIRPPLEDGKPTPILITSGPKTGVQSVTWPSSWWRYLMGLRNRIAVSTNA